MAGPVNRGTGSSGQQQRGQESSAGGMMESVKDKAQEMASTVASRAEDAWDSARQGAQQMTSSAASTAEDAWQGVETFFRRYPVPMFFAGIGLGFLLAKAFDNLSTDMTSRMSDASNRWGGRP
jgi:ElaB/YqjD/DUF883 family membrane-anchored ribosome-binding protein